MFWAYGVQCIGFCSPRNVRNRGAKLRMWHSSAETFCRWKGIASWKTAAMNKQELSKMIQIYIWFWFFLLPELRRAILDSGCTNASALNGATRAIAPLVYKFHALTLTVRCHALQIVFFMSGCRRRDSAASNLTTGLHHELHPTNCPIVDTCKMFGSSCPRCFVDDPYFDVPCRSPFRRQMKRNEAKATIFICVFNNLITLPIQRVTNAPEFRDLKW